VTSASSVVRPLSKQRASERPINQLINLNCCRIFSPMPHYCSAQLISFLQLSALLAWLIAAIVNETGSWNARRRIRTLTPQERRQVVRSSLPPLVFQSIACFDRKLSRCIQVSHREI
jgi:hypothetical protein